jgi:TRAP-type C4-dicarboxylate transport system permease small subunit
MIMKKYTSYVKNLTKVIPLFLFVVLGAAVLASASAHAQADKILTGANSVSDGATTDLTVIITNVINILLFLVGTTAVIMLIIGGFRYVTSNGDSSAITSAKNTILYSIVGIIVALAAFAIVNFVLSQF